MTTRNQKLKQNLIFGTKEDSSEVTSPPVDIPPVLKSKPSRFNILSKIKSINLPVSNKHLVLGLLVRLLFILIGEQVDKYFHVAYTDVDYKVFTDAAQYVSKGISPYSRATYRYSPILSYICLGNIYIHRVFAKVVFSLFDVLGAIVVYKISLSLSTHKLAYMSFLVYLYNPISIVISTRGNSDSIICFLVLLTLLSRIENKAIPNGIYLGLSIHLRMYPLLFSLPIFLSYRNVRQRVYLVIGCLVTLLLLTGAFYYLYKMSFLEESYLYHLSRTDIKHNYSIHFLSQYLDVSSVYTKLLPLLLLQVLCSIKFYTLENLPLCLAVQCYIFVSFSPVITCQYFSWFISLLIPILPALVNVKALTYRFILWVVVQLLWLLPAYYLEYKGKDVFLYVFILCTVFFIVNVNIIVNLIQYYKPMKKIQ